MFLSAGLRASAARIQLRQPSPKPPKQARERSVARRGKTRPLICTFDSLTHCKMRPSLRSELLSILCNPASWASISETVASASLSPMNSASLPSPSSPSSAKMRSRTSSPSAAFSANSAAPPSSSATLSICRATSAPRLQKPTPSLKPSAPPSPSPSTCGTSASPPPKPIATSTPPDVPFPATARLSTRSLPC